MRKLGRERLSSFTGDTGENGFLQNWGQDFNPDMSASRHKAINPITSAGIENNQKVAFWDFPGSPVLTTSPSNAKDTGLIPGQAAKIPHALWSKKQNIKQNARRDTVTNSVKTWKNTKIAFWVGWKFIDLKGTIYIGEENRNTHTSSPVIGK